MKWCDKKWLIWLIDLMEGQVIYKKSGEVK